MFKVVAIFLIVLTYGVLEPSCPYPSNDYINLFYGTDFKNSSIVGAPDRSCSYCPRESNLPGSLEYKGQRRTWTLFRNDAMETVVIYFVNSKGEEIQVGLLIPGQRQRMRTFEGHLFRIYSSDKKTLYLEYLVGLVPLYNDFKVYSARPLATSEKMNKEDINRTGEPNWELVYPTGFVNRAGYNLDLYWNGRRGLELVAQMRPNEVHREFTYERHVWRAQIHDESQVLTEHGVAVRIFTGFLFFQKQLLFFL